MRLSIEEGEQFTETEVVIRCRKNEGQLTRLISLLQSFDKKLSGQKDGQTYLLEMEQVLYIDTADKRTFLYTAEGVYETPLRLYELEERLRDKDFFRAGKSALVNFNAIQSLRPDMGGRIRLTMEGGETVYVSRQYAPWLKKRLGL